MKKEIKGMQQVRSARICNEEGTWRYAIRKEFYICNKEETYLKIFNKEGALGKAMKKELKDKQ